jgi:Domain of unknown function (DUF4410)
LKRYWKIFARIKISSITLVLIFVLGLLAGCSPTGSFKIHESIEEVTVKATIAALTVTSSTPSGYEVTLQLRWEVASQLREAGLFKSITGQGDQNADYKISIILTTIDEVPYQDRYHFGFLAGSDKIAGDVIVIDVKTGQIVRSFSFSSKSAVYYSLSGKIFMDEAIHKAAEEIVKGLR